MIKKILATVLAAVIAFGAYGQDLLKCNYKKNNYVFTGAERVSVAASTPLQLKLVRVAFPDGVSLYDLRIDFESDAAWKIPKNASITFELAGGNSITSKNHSDSPNLVAPSGFEKADGKKVWYNCGEYYLEQADLEKLLKGVKSLDAVRRWSSNGHIVVKFKNNEFSIALAKAYDAIKSAPEVKNELGAHLTGLDDNSGNRIATTEVLPVDERTGLSLTYLYSGESNQETYDLEFHINGVTVPGGSQVALTTPAGTIVRLRQEKDLEEGEVVCYPSIEQIKLLYSAGVTGISLETANGNLDIPVNAKAFAQTLSVLYNSVQTVAVL